MGYPTNYTSSSQRKPVHLSERLSYSPASSLFYELLSPKYANEEVNAAVSIAHLILKMRDNLRSNL